MKNSDTSLIILCSVILFVTIILTMNIGRYSVNLIEIWKIINGNFSEDLSYEKYVVFFNLRLPRVIFAACVGCALAVAGAVLQALFRNPLASPNIIGVMQGANFGAAFAIAFLFVSSYIVNTFAFIFGLIAIVIAYVLALKSDDDSIAVIVLIGIVISSVFQAGVSLVIYLSDPYETLPKITYRLMGSLQAAIWKNILLPIPIIIISTAFLIIFSWRLNVMSLSDEEASSLGIDVHKWRFIYLIFATILVAAAVSVCGNIMWIGLIIPHITRQMVGPDHKKLIPFSALIGSIFLVIVDTLVRSITAAEIPISIITSFIGAPFLGYLVLRKRRLEKCQ